MDFLYLDEKQMIDAGVKDMPRCMDSMEYMFSLLRQGDYRMGGENHNEHGLAVKFPKESAIPNMPLGGPDRRFMSMIAYLGGKYRMVGVKSYGSNHENVKLDLPRSILMMSLMDVDTGAPLAYMSANILSAMRTGAVAGIGAKYLSPKHAEKLAVIGPGVMSRYALDAIMTACPHIRSISVLGRGEKNLSRFKKHCDDRGYILDSYAVCASEREVCEDADIIFTGSTRNATFEENRYIKREYIKRGALVIGSSAGVRFDKDFLENASDCVRVSDDDKTYETPLALDAKAVTEEAKKTETVDAAFHRIFVSGGKLVNIADIISDKLFTRDEEKTYIYGAYGLPVEDVAWGCECYMRALRMGIGTKLDLWETSQL